MGESTYASRIERAELFFQKQKCSPEYLREKFGIGLKPAINIVSKPETNVKDVTWLFDDLEKEIEGLDHTYNPERDIKHIQLTY